MGADNLLLIDHNTGDMGLLLPHSLMGNASAIAAKQGSVSGQYSDMRLTMKGQDAGRRSSNIAEMLGLGRAPHFQIETMQGVRDDFFKHDNDNVLNADAPRPDTGMLRAFAADLSSGAPTLQEVAQILQSGDGDAIKMVAEIVRLQQALNDPATTQQQVEAILQTIADISKSRPELLTTHKKLNKMLRGLVAQAAKTFPSAKIEALAQLLTKPLSPQDMLDQSVEATIAALQAMVDDESLDDDIRAEAEAMIETLENLPEGEPIPLELFQQLQSMAERLEGTPHALALLTAAKDMRSANIIFKAHKFGLSVAEIHQIESTTSDLSALSSGLQKSNQKGVKALASQLNRAIKSVDANPLSVASYAGLSVIAPVLSAPAVQTVIAQVAPSSTSTQITAEAVQNIANIQEPILTRAPLNSPQAEGLKQNLNIPATIETIRSEIAQVLTGTLQLSQTASDSMAGMAIATQAAIQTMAQNGVKQGTAMMASAQTILAKVVAQAQAVIQNARTSTPATTPSETSPQETTSTAPPPTGIDAHISVEVQPMQAGQAGSDHARPYDATILPLDEMPHVSFDNLVKDKGVQAAIDASATSRAKSLTQKFTEASSPIQKSMVIVTHISEKVMDQMLGCASCATKACGACGSAFLKAVTNIKKMTGLATKPEAPAKHFRIGG